MSSFTTCPACHYTRQPTDDAPDWECPKCQKAYIKIASAEHQQHSSMTAKYSSDYIQVLISGENNLKSGSQIQFDPPQHVDPMAIQIDWTTASYLKTGDLSRELVEVSADRLEFRVTKKTHIFALSLILIGIACAVGPIFPTRPIPGDVIVKVVVTALLFSSIFIAIGCYAFNLCKKAVVFDKLRGCFWNERKASDGVPDRNPSMDFVLLENIHAIQLIYWDERRGQRMGINISQQMNRYVELNLVLRGGDRVNAVIYYIYSDDISIKNPRQHAETLAKFLKKPVWDAIETTRNYWILKR